MLLGGSILLLVLGALGLGWWWNLRPRVLRADAPPAAQPVGGFTHAAFESLLRRFVDDAGRIAYDRWANDAGARTELDAYLAAIEETSPENEPARFQDRSDRLAYWLNAYNACVIKAVLVHWPLQSVTDVKAPFEIVQGLGFFAKLRFVIGGRPYSLYEIEHEQIADRFEDPRIHFVLNCASGSCPVLQPELPQGPDLEEYLADAARRFVAEQRNVDIDHRKGRVVLSAIFSMYEAEFTNALRRQGLPGGLVAYVASVAPAPLQAELVQAKNYTLSFHEFDWSINRQGDAR